MMKLSKYELRELRNLIRSKRISLQSLIKGSGVNEIGITSVLDNISIDESIVRRVVNYVLTYNPLPNDLINRVGNYVDIHIQDEENIPDQVLRFIVNKALLIQSIGCVYLYGIDLSINSSHNVLLPIRNNRVSIWLGNPKGEIEVFWAEEVIGIIKVKVDY